MPENSLELADTQNFGAVSAQLTSKQELFAQAYVQGSPVVDAYCWAYNVGEGSARATARNNGYKLLRHPRVAARIRELQDAVAAQSGRSTAALIGELEEMVSADLNELMQVVVGSCRHCWGTHGAYQWRDDHELMAAQLQSMHTGEPPPDPTGGAGYVFERDPNPECSKCDGAGKQVVRMTNTADLSPGVRRLFRGIELFPDGSVKRVLLHDQMAARVELHRLRGLHVERSLAVHAHVTAPPIENMTTDQALDFLESLRPTTRPLLEHKPDDRKP